MNNLTLLIVFLVAIILFFWGIVKTIKTQKKIYIFAMLPFFLLMVGMFLL